MSKRRAEIPKPLTVALSSLSQECPSIPHALWSKRTLVSVRRGRTRSWGGARPRGHPRCTSRRCGRRRCYRRRWSWSRSRPSENGTDVADHSTDIGISKTNIVQNVECTADLSNPVTSSVCRPQDGTSLTNGSSIVCIGKGNIP
jgi:hypothetical protein